jgi:hypothetical protein
MNSRICLAIVLLAILFAGCGPKGPKLYPIKGTVTYNGEPLPEGDIVLMPTSPGEVEDANKIKDGKFEFGARAGAKRVKITANRSEGPPDPQMGVSPRRQYIPERYSSAEKTELTLTVEEVAKAENGKNEFKFDLTGP